MLNPNVNAAPTAITSGTTNNVPAHVEEVKDWINGGSINRRLTQAQIDALSGTEKTIGVVVYNSTIGALQRWDGSEWRTHFEPRRGIVASAAGGYADVTFSPAFATAPVVMVTPVTTSTPGAGLNSVPYVVQSEVTASGMRIRGLSLTTGCHWVAFGV